MDKSLEANVLVVIASLFKDFEATYTSMGQSLSRDTERLNSLFKNRGLHSLMDDLPNLDSMLLRGLETGVLVLRGPLSKRVSKKIKVPRFLSGLWLRVFDEDGVLRSSVDTTAVAFIRQVSCFVKSLKLECSRAVKTSTAEEYFNVDSELRESDLLWSDMEFDYFGRGPSLHFCDGLDPDRENNSFSGTRSDESFLIRLQGICDSVSGYLGYYDPYAFTSKVGRSCVSSRYLSHGRGAVSDQARYDNRYHFPSWNDRLNVAFPYDAFGRYDFSLPDESISWNTTPVSKLIAVRKTVKKPRLIASEPTANMWCQQVTMRWLVDRISNTPLTEFIDLTRQDLSQRLVRKASLDQSLATVDLSSASDRLSCWVVERVFRRNPMLLQALHSHRTPYIRDSIRSGDVHFLKKFASQGSAVTFPVQTIVFLCIALAACGVSTVQGAKRLKGKVRVYGDDIILPTSAYEDLSAYLSFLQLKINDKKSYHLGFFRESCGLDCYKGDDITPVKPQHLVSHGPESEMALIDTSNNFFLKGYWYTAEAIRSIVSRSKITLPVVGVEPKQDKELPVTRNDSGVTGWLSFCGGMDNPSAKSRWNRNLHVIERRYTVFNDECTRTPSEDETSIFQFFAENPSPLKLWSAGVAGKPRLRKKTRWVEVVGKDVPYPGNFPEGTTF